MKPACYYEQSADLDGVEMIHQSCWTGHRIGVSQEEGDRHHCRALSKSGPNLTCVIQVMKSTNLTDNRTKFIYRTRVSLPLAIIMSIPYL